MDSCIISQSPDPKRIGVMGLTLDLSTMAGMAMADALFFPLHGGIVGSYPSLLRAAGKGRSTARHDRENGYEIIGSYFPDESYMFVLVSLEMLEVCPFACVYLGYAGKTLPEKFGYVSMGPEKDHGKTYENAPWEPSEEEAKAVAEFEKALSDFYHGVVRVSEDLYDNGN